MSGLAPKQDYPVLPVLTASPRWQWRLGLWIAVAAVLHGMLYAVALRSAEQRRDRAAIAVDVKSEHAFIVVNPPPPVEPVRNELEAETAAASKEQLTPQAKPKGPRKPKQRPGPAAKTPKSAESAAQPTPQFKDVGVLGSLDVAATGTGRSTFRVAVGESGVGAAVGTGGVVTQLAAVAGTSDRRKAITERVVAGADLSAKATPDDTYNQQIKAPYPHGLREAGVEGAVRAVLTVGSDGAVGRVNIVRSDHEAFKQAATMALKKFRFQPARDRKGKKVASNITVTYRFTLE